MAALLPSPPGLPSMSRLDSPFHLPRATRDDSALPSLTAARLGSMSHRFPRAPFSSAVAHLVLVRCYEPCASRCLLSIGILLANAYPSFVPPFPMT